METAEHTVARTRLLSKLRAELGVEALRSLDDDGVVEVLLNNDGTLWEDSFAHGMRVIGKMNPINAESLIGTVAASMGTVGNAENPVVQGLLLTHNARFQGVLPPNANGPIFAIRKRASRIYTLDQYVADGILKPEWAEVIKQAVVQAKNILVIGGTGSGKTTLANAILAAMAELVPHTRVGIIEDTAELQCALPNKFLLGTSDFATTDKLVAACMRLRPDRIVVGEVRDRAADSLLKAWNTGHPGGLATVHANDVVAALGRMEDLAMEAGVTITREVAQRRIGQAVNLIVSIQRQGHAGGRRVEAVLEVNGCDGGAYALRHL
ncbi:P-type conjugative transfer ATPase TrbB [Ralstonia thomasii]|uniref:P-type conjugative transfer ATPase TrbB n=1 Tax=Ralstonia thomasii TaxID=3058596 RepID=UPI003C2DC45D